MLTCATSVAHDHVASSLILSLELTEMDGCPHVARGPRVTLQGMTLAASSLVTYHELLKL